MADQRQKVSAKIEGINWEDFASPEDLKNAQMELGQLRNRVVETDLKLGKLEAKNRDLEEAKALLVSENHSLKVQLEQQVNKPGQGLNVHTEHVAAIETLNKQLGSERGLVRSMEDQLRTLKKRVEELESQKLSPTPETINPPAPPPRPPPPPVPPQPPVTSNPFGL